MTIPPPDPAPVARFRADVIALTGPAPGRLGVAVSGGADSLALLLLAAAAFRGGDDGAPPAAARCDLYAISIDHGLRPEAAAECRFVAETCATLGVPHETIAVAVRETGRGVQAAARDARRAAFGGWCRRRAIGWLATGHHMDDQAETVLMRLARGSGVGGLAGIPEIGPLPTPEGGREGAVAPPLVMRPLLGWRRAELRRIVAGAGLRPVDDPSNSDDRFDRTRFRDLLATTDLLDVPRIAAAARHCRDAEATLNAAMLASVRTAFRNEDGIATLDLAPLAPRPPGMTHRILREVLARLGAHPDGPSITRLIAALDAGRAATLAGIKVTPRDGTWRFTQAPPRRSHRASLFHCH